MAWYLNNYIITERVAIRLRGSQSSRISTRDVVMLAASAMVNDTFRWFNLALIVFDNLGAASRNCHWSGASQKCSSGIILFLSDSAVTSAVTANPANWSALSASTLAFWASSKSMVWGGVSAGTVFFRAIFSLA